MLWANSSKTGTVNAANHAPPNALPTTTGEGVMKQLLSDSDASTPQRKRRRSIIDIVGIATLPGLDVCNEHQQTRRKETAEGDNAAQTVSEGWPRHRACAVGNHAIRQPKP